MALKCVILLLAIACFMATANSSQEPPRPPILLGGFNLTARLETDARFADCWKALMEKKSCTGEIVHFLTCRRLTVIHPPCCRAILMTTNHCWSALGFTAEETHVLEGYCAQSSSPPPTPNSL
uniref:Putative egg cell-secreted protein 1.4 n=1 Tax=Davidia involucrata TaxID=16924 RepID=A0A5B7AED3_DAVIN